jgi:hypothetical protein
MARGKNRRDFGSSSVRTIPLTPHVGGSGDAPQAPGSLRMILKADGSYVESYNPKPRPVPTFAEIRARSEENQKHAGPSWEALKATLRSRGRH